MQRHDHPSTADFGSEDPTILPDRHARVDGQGRPDRRPPHHRPRSNGVGRAPERLGEYRILGVLGEGGMGKVYLAEQSNPKRTVALKVIRPGWATPSLLRRFEHETEALARLQHPGIAQIYGSGVHEEHGDRVPFFAMECVRGLSLTRYAEAKGLDTAERLRLFARVCDAVQHAHAKGVIHRDLKPGNIVVPEDGQPRVLDFGVARVTDADIQTATLCTVQGELVGTVPYMSPEQIAGDAAALDTRSDVYSLGVVLYELLTAKLPHDVRQTSIAQAARMIGEQEPARLSSVNRVYRGDIETIVGKALEKERDRRYQSAAELAADIRRFLQNEPIAAQPPSTAYQMRKFARRNKPVVLGVAAVVVMLLVGVVATGLQAVSATRENARVQREAADAAVSMRILADALEAVSPEDSLGREPLGLDHPEAFGPLNNLAVLLKAGGKYAEANALFAELIENAGAVLPEDHYFLGVIRSNAGECCTLAGEYARAEPLLVEAERILSGSLGDEHPRTVKAVERLVDLYARWERHESTELWRGVQR